ncbi:beta-galactosidase 7-like protein [Sesbania bispinosa]|nr:beta-galactosidase 7-like protein [Sesbania bispinosa]
MASTMCLPGQCLFSKIVRRRFSNTAKVNTQTTVYVKKPATEGNPLKWFLDIRPNGRHPSRRRTFKASELLEQKGVTVDASDYLWYMTEVCHQ